MENISLKLEKEFLKEIEKIMAKHRYSTKTEFIREAIRDKMKELEKRDALRKLDNIFGSSKRKTTEEDIHRARERAFEELDKEL
jgi:Arc/MetJ-type ribon-helix-helix transcriptional regulator